ncbi:hypothetical protein PAEVO_03840 [Paenibacillus sp. GM2FR]|uniref:SGNH/GDSL hydrolase family protein n=1 Tax=Paenibacillus sp. GM2FR TaxID=2059268 RepID=UPI000C2765D5|nr:SGNH/GDSL hydrolase family protein [Paenibacillus sp. GM2FR]PJN53663.1 hypothetical protein PAEVO_03840 [Paenibacillus sp. GM2FR]
MKDGETMRSRFPWRDTSEDIADQAHPQWETPGGAQQKADKAEQNAKEYSDAKLSAHVGTGGSAHALATPNGPAGFISGTDQAKINGIESGAEVNQNAFSMINGIGASTKEDAVDIEGGVGITITPDPVSKKVRVTATGTATPGLHGTEHTGNGSDPIPVATETVSGLMSPADKQAIADITAQLAEKANQTSLDETNLIIAAKSLSAVMDLMTKGQPTKIVCYGDSITFGYKVGTGVQVANPYPAELQSKLRLIYGNNNINVVNKGHTGWRSPEAIANVQEVLAESPHVAVVMFGINDCKGSSLGTVVPVYTFKENMKSVITALKEAGICVVLCSTTPYLTSATESKKIKPYNQALKAIALEFNLEFVDLEKEVATVYQERFVSDINLLPDGVHFGDGYYAYLSHIILKKFWIFPDASSGVTIPAVSSPFVVTDTTVIYTDAGQFYGRNIILRGTGGVADGSYIRFPFFCSKKGLKLYILHPKSSSGTVISVRLNGAVVATLDSYNATFVYDVETLISDSLGFGLYVLELLRTDSTTPGAGGTYNNFVSAFVFKT